MRGTVSSSPTDAIKKHFNFCQFDAGMLFLCFSLLLSDLLVRSVYFHAFIDYFYFLLHELPSYSPCLVLKVLCILDVTP